MIYKIFCKIKKSVDTTQFINCLAIADCCVKLYVFFLFYISQGVAKAFHISVAFYCMYAVYIIVCFCLKVNLKLGLSQKKKTIYISDFSTIAPSYHLSPYLPIPSSTPPSHTLSHLHPYIYTFFSSEIRIPNIAPKINYLEFVIYIV